MWSKKLVIPCAITIVAIVATVGYLRLYTREEAKPQPMMQYSIALNLDGAEIQTANVSNEEVKQTQELIDRFEKRTYEKDFVSAIGMLTPPVDKEQQSWLDHLLGKDLASINGGKPSPRFLGKAEFHVLAGYDLQKIEKKNDIIYATVEELRILDVAAEGASAAFQTSPQALVFELVGVEGGLRISRYYHLKPTSLANLKYEGFVAY